MPVARLYRRVRGVHHELPVYLLAMALTAVCGGIFENTYNNFLYAEFRLPPTTRGNLEFIREFPGLMNVALMAALAFLPEARVAMLASLITVAGMAGFGLWGGNWWLMLLFTLLWGVGSHLIMPISSSLTMRFGGENKRGTRLGQVGAVTTVGSIAGAAVVWVAFSLGHERAAGPRTEAQVLDIAPWQFDLSFYLAAAACVGAALCFGRLRHVGAQAKRPPFVMKWRYWLFYVLNVLYGARKQIFLTFGRWVLVTVFLQPPTTFAKLWIIGSLVGLVFTPVAGALVDRFGERTMLLIDAGATALICFGYGMAEHLGFSDRGALVFVCACFVLDYLFFAVSMARDTYVAKIAESRDELTATLSMGVTINHLIAMIVPWAGGLLWFHYGYEWVFAAAGGLALVMAGFAAMVRVPGSIQHRSAPR